MLEMLYPEQSRPARALLQHLASIVGGMKPEHREVWQERLSYIYGTLDGQRGLDLGELRSKSPWLATIENPLDAIIVLQTYFVFVAYSIACLSASNAPQTLAAEYAALEKQKLAPVLESLLSGERLHELGFTGAESTLPFTWCIDALDDRSLKVWRDMLTLLGRVTKEDRNSLLHHPDPFGHLYTQIIPRNILHTLGEVYTPRWLADILIEEIDLEGSETVLDPFCGSGVFILAALDAKARTGIPLRQAMNEVRGVDLNPAACVASRANLVLAMHAHGLKLGPEETIALPILCADSLVPALLLAGGAHDSEQGWQSAGQVTLNELPPSDIIATNPPWVGWEYQSRRLRESVQPGWEHYELYSSRTTNKAFLKEDLSTLALVAVWNTLLSEGGRSVAVMRTSAMTSSIASSGLRRLSLHPQSEPIQLKLVNVFNKIKIFERATVETASWLIHKGSPTVFPVPARLWSSSRPRWRPTSSATAREVRDNVKLVEGAVSPTDKASPSGRWLIGDARCIKISEKLVGTCPYRGRTGVFTGGANGVYYLQRERSLTEHTSLYTNITRRNKRRVPKVTVELEDALVYEVVRGRDLSRFQLKDTGLLLCPHTATTKMQAISPEILAADYPRTHAYLSSFKETLDKRAGFTNWEKKFRDDAFYAIQRIGSYSFAEYKVCWKYIAKDFITAVIGPDNNGKPRLPNDKIVSIAVNSETEAHFLCALLSSSPIRWQVISHTSGNQISSSTINALMLPIFNKNNPTHTKLSKVCYTAHSELISNPTMSSDKYLFSIDQIVQDIFSLSKKEIKTFQQAL